MNIHYTVEGLSGNGNTWTVTGQTLLKNEGDFPLALTRLVVERVL